MTFKGEFNRLNVTIPWQLLFAVFGLAHWLGDRLPVPQLRPLKIGEYPVELSPWWWLPLAVAVLGVLPGALGYWLAPKPKWRYLHPFFSLLVRTLLMAACSVLGLPGGILYAVFGVVILTDTWALQEAARWGYSPETGQQGVVVRNRLTRSLEEILVIFALAIGWVVLDTLARSGANRGWADTVAMILVALAPGLPVLRRLAEVVRSRITKKGGAPAWTPLIGLIAVALAVFLLFIIDLWVHKLLTYNERWAWFAIGITLAFSFAVGQALSFLNQSSLHASYSVRTPKSLARAIERG